MAFSYLCHHKPGRSFSHDPSNPQLITWTRFQLASSSQPDTNAWASYFQPLVHDVGHCQTVWGRVKKSARPEVLVVTLWWTASEYKDFKSSPTAQLYHETLATSGIVLLATRETVYSGASPPWFHLLQKGYIQLISVDFPAPVDEPQRAQIQKLRGYRPPALRFHAQPDEWDAMRGPVIVWAAQTEWRDGQEVQLMLWPHFWRDADRAGRRLVASVRERFGRQLEQFRSVEWQEEFLEFELVPCI
ncbi:hypothetical protein BO82DRAFT_432247 [Aspergillus uvarum CBS 121591]|uniref:ABM domain-containing protein n=1 Tax=Aspergillus uvarum CBS 121591 TaxID=1448315 RepID=A0A319C7R0_9EURO|nr:hypothetical protein BO82DRAFT_432247 [Aspergillus uvarum CBS 121591]PYH81856.1 hypothetical protein BO82DRAFT_432247 [Aspergillus uvarum CBS 121591]